MCVRSRLLVARLAARYGSSKLAEVQQQVELVKGVMKGTVGNLSPSTLFSHGHVTTVFGATSALVYPQIIIRLFLLA